MKNKILELLSGNDVVQEILKKNKHVGNLYPMEEALVLASAFQKDNKTRIIVKKNKYEAQQLYQRLSPIVDNVLLFVMEESLRVQMIASSPEDKEQMILSLNECIFNDTPRIIICNTAAFLRYLPKKEVYQSCCLELEVNQEFSMEELKNRLYRNGYAKVNYVDRPRSFASRGGIVDIYSLEYENPIRVEFFDTEIDSIRFFDEKTQRTIGTTNKIQIGPATDILFSDQEIQTIEEQVKEKLEKTCAKLNEDEKEVLIDQVEKDLRSIENYDADNRLYLYYAYLQPDSILDYVDGQVILSSQEEVERFERQLKEENITFLQELVQDYRYLAKYSVFHDLIRLEKNRKFSYFHEFLDYDNPIVSNIYPIEASNNILDTLRNYSFKNLYIALSEENRKALPLEELSCSYEFINPDFNEGFVYEDNLILTNHEIQKKTNIKPRFKKKFKEGQVLENILELQPNDYVVHEQYGIGQYVGIITKETNGRKLDYLHVIYAKGDSLFVPLSQFQLVRKYISKEGVGIKLSELGTNKWQKTKEKVNQRVEEIAGKLVELYAVRNQNIGFAFPEDDALQIEFDNAFEYEPTDDQLIATEEIKQEMMKEKPMDHLLCGDVGFGKTEVAMRAAFKAIMSNKQVALLCPTTILSMQHYKSFKERFGYTGARIELVNRFVPPAKIKEITKAVEEGSVDIVIGTHKLLNKSFVFKDLGLLIVDEEQRFGVEHKERIKEVTNSVDVLTLSATPIPRTLQMSLIGVRTISQLNTPPAHRHPIQTYVMEKRGNVIKEVIQRELSRGGQVFYLYNKVSDIYLVAKKIQEDFPDIKVGVAHGKMDRETIEETMMDFAENKFQVMVCTTIIETGLDIANANTIIIENADKFGLSQLYQIRGRVGRRDKIGYCYLLVQPQKELSEQASKRLKSIKEFTQLGSGYKIAMRDLTIRGAGDMLGPQQAGFIDQIGLDLYLEMLANAIARKKGEAPLEKAEPQKQSAVRLNGYIPEQFTENDGDKLSLYQDIYRIRNVKELAEYEKKVQDLYGRIPKQVAQLFEQKKLDIFTNVEGVDSLRELETSIIITMTPKWTNHCNGVKLFEVMNGISKKIQMRLKNNRIEIAIMKKGKYLDLLMKIIYELENNEVIYAPR
ncbi:MAG: transcription-repair coupling factor [Firmicutes bacterium]|nr:transcription-repair coupling factor [Bacillota bacterium]